MVLFSNQKLFVLFFKKTIEINTKIIEIEIERQINRYYWVRAGDRDRWIDVYLEKLYRCTYIYYEQYIIKKTKKQIGRCILDIWMEIWMDVHCTM